MSTFPTEGLPRRSSPPKPALRNSASSTSAAAATQFKPNTLRALGLTSPKRYELAPDIPTIAEQGLPGYATSSTTLLLAPTNTPKEIVHKISAAFQQARESPDVKQKLNAIGQAVSTESPAESIAALRAEAQLWWQLIAERDIKFSQ